MSVYGTAGGGLKNPTWLDNRETAAAGLRGEQRLAAHLEHIASPNVAIFHDLIIPGSKANIDHAVVSGKVITLIDAKVWKPGFYWTLGGKTRRGLEVFPPADKKTLPFAVSRLERLLLSRGVQATFRRPFIAVWSSQKGQRVNTQFARPYGARFIAAAQLTSARIGARPADERIVGVLKTLLPH